MYFYFVCICNTIFVFADTRREGVALICPTKREMLRRLFPADGSPFHNCAGGSSQTMILEIKPSEMQAAPSRYQRTRSAVASFSGSSSAESDTHRIRRTLSASGSQTAGPIHRTSISREIHQGASATFRNVLPRRSSRSASPIAATSVSLTTASPTAGLNHTLLQPPEITFDEVLTVPSTPISDAEGLGQAKGNGGGAGLSPYGCDGNSRLVAVELANMVAATQPRAVMMAPRGSLITLSQSPLEFSESTFSVNYTDDLGE